MFSIRNIGNQIVTSEGSVDYGVRVLKTPYLMVVGHSGCGAIKAAHKGKKTKIAGIDKELLCARYFSPPLRQKRSPLHTNFFAALCHPPF